MRHSAADPAVDDAAVELAASQMSRSVPDAFSLWPLGQLLSVTIGKKENNGFGAIGPDRWCGAFKSSDALSGVRGQETRAKRGWSTTRFPVAPMSITLACASG